MLIIIDVKKDWNQEKWWNTMLYENVLIKIKCAKLKFSRKMMKYNVIWKCSYKN